MSFTLVDAGRTGYNGSPATSIATSAPVAGVSVGDVVVALVSSNSNTDTLTSVSDGTSNLTAADTFNFRIDIGSQFYYFISPNSGSLTYTANWNAGTAGDRGICVYVFHPSATAAFDVSRNDQNAGASTAMDSGLITPTGSDEIVFGGGRAENASISAPLINGSAATGQINISAAIELWYLATAGAAGNATATCSSGNWTCGAISFKISGAAAQNKIFYVRA